MSDIAIKIENVSKLYRLGEVGTGTLSNDLNRWWAKVRGKEDPYAKVGTVNDRTQKAEGDYVWAVKDISFDVKQGEVLGIIGRNGAGKSTLLKMLSRTTLPTEGFIKAKGRIASLLEVGTGFHPELTGRENIYQNGAILGMRHSEIKRKFDEIVDFAGVVKYIDTPVKRYSSGMYVRLAFAVAAHLEPEILVVDEVLAVGDAEFQKKCLGKMKDVSVNEGRTVLFVSHNLQSISSLCSRVVYMKNGTLKADGLPDKIIKEYFDDTLMVNSGKLIKDFARDQKHYGKALRIESISCTEQIYHRENVKITFSFRRLDPIVTNVEFGIGFNDSSGIRICTYESDTSFEFGDKDMIEIEMELKSPHFVPGKYFLNLGIRSSVQTLDHVEYAASFEVMDVDTHGNHFGFTLGSMNSGYIDCIADTRQLMV